MPRAFEGQGAFQYQKISKEEQERRGILGRLVGRIADPTKPTRNGRLYDHSLWERVINDPIFNEKLENRVLFGEFEHPLDGRTSIEPKNITVCLAEKPKFGKDGFLYGVFDILNTECGRLLKTLLDYGSTFAISSRGDGDLFTNSRGQEQVDSDTYQCFAFDIVGIPGVKEARLTPVMESFSGKKSLNESLFELYNASDDKDHFMETLNNLGISLTEDVDYTALAKEAKELLKDNYGEITNKTNLRKALKKAVEDQKVADVQTIAKLICKYDSEYVKLHSKIAELAEQPMKTDSLDNIALPDDLPTEEATDEVTNIPTETPATEEENDLIPPSTEPEMPESSADVSKQENFENKIVYNNIDESLKTEKEFVEDLLNITIGYMNSNKDDPDYTRQYNLPGTEDVWDSDYLHVLLDARDYIYKLLQKYTDSQQHEETFVDDIDEGNKVNDDGNSVSAIIDSLQEALKTKQDTESEVLKLNEKLSVCYAKEAKQDSIIAKLQENLKLAESAKEDVSKLQSRTEKQTALIESANQTIRDLNKKCSEIVTKYNALAEKYNSNRTQLSSLNENMSSQSSKIISLTEANRTLTEDLTKANEALTESKKTYSEKLQESNQIIEKYKKVANRAINKYIDSQALKLDITSQEIKNRLPENYTFNDIDSICESLQAQKVSMNLLPFKTPNKLYENMNVEITGKVKKEPILDQNKVLVDDEVDDSLMCLAKM